MSRKLSADDVRVIELKSACDSEVYKPVFKAWLKSRKPIIPAEKFLSQLRAITAPWRLTILEFDKIIDPDLLLPELRPEDYPPHLQAEFAELLVAVEPKTKRKAA